MYNLGNASYKEGDYNSAVSYFSEAVKKNPSGEKDCLTRINLALSICNTIDFNDLDTKEKTDMAIGILKKAKAVLLENECASENGNGHNADAQQLKEDIDRTIAELENPGSSGEEPDKEPDDDSENVYETHIKQW